MPRLGKNKMNLSRNELIKALIKGLKLDDNIFNYQAVAEEIEYIQDRDFMDFYKASMAENTYGNGLQAIMKVAEQFKPRQTDLTEIKAKELIQWCETANATIFDEANKSGLTFDDELKRTGFVRLIEESDTLTILNAVKPHCDYKKLVANISLFENGAVELQAFKNAIHQTQRGGLATSYNVRKMIKVKR